MTTEEIQGILKLDRRYINDRDYKVLQYAIKSARESSRVTEKDFEELRSLGFSDIELLEISEAIANGLYQSNFADSLANRLTWLQKAAGEYK